MSQKIVGQCGWKNSYKINIKSEIRFYKRFLMISEFFIELLIQQCNKQDTDLILIRKKVFLVIGKGF